MSRLVRYLIVAVLIYVIDMGGYYCLLKLNVGPVLANAVVKVAATLCGFFMHRRFTYRIKGFDGASADAIKYFGLGLVYTPLSSGVVYLLIHVIHHPVYAKFASDVLLFIATYWVTTKFTFARKKQSPQEKIAPTEAQRIKNIDGS